MAHTASGIKMAVKSSMSAKRRYPGVKLLVQHAEEPLGAAFLGTMISASTDRFGSVDCTIVVGTQFKPETRSA